MENSNNKKKTLLSLIGVLLLILFSVGVTFAFMSYSRTGERNNVINTGSVTFSFEDNSYIWLQNALPISVEQGCSLEKNSGGTAMKTEHIDGGVAQFTVTSNSTTRVNYSVYLDQETLSNGTYTSPTKDLSFQITNDSKMISPFLIGLNLNTDTTGAIFSDTGLGGDTYIEASNNTNNSFDATFNENAWQKAAAVNMVYSYGMSDAKVNFTNNTFERISTQPTREVYNLPGPVNPNQYLFNPLIYTKAMYIYDDINEVYKRQSSIPENDLINSLFSKLYLKSQENLVIEQDPNYWTGCINCHYDYTLAIRMYNDLDLRTLKKKTDNSETFSSSSETYNSVLISLPISYPKYFSLMDLERADGESFKLGDGSMLGNQSRYFELRLWIADEHVNVSDSDVFRKFTIIDTHQNTNLLSAQGWSTSGRVVLANPTFIRESYRILMDQYNDSAVAIDMLNKDLFMTYWGFGEFPNLTVDDLDNLEDIYYNATFPSSMNKYKTFEYFNSEANSNYYYYTESPYNRNFPILTYGYNTNEWKNMYYSMKIRVEANA